jgi:hypothetical protein
MRCPRTDAGLTAKHLTGCRNLNLTYSNIYTSKIIFYSEESGTRALMKEAAITAALVKTNQRDGGFEVHSRPF